ncbi:MAG: MotA/TolQ/ExbB proton channel family protein [bacterium]|nr:MotA/TolQ/ExbB proton channel family protein [bacterium]
MFDTIARFFQSGGPMMWVILAVFAAALAVIGERLRFHLRAAREDADTLATGAAARLNDGDTAGALESLEGSSPARLLMQRAVEMSWEGATPTEIRAGVEELAIGQVPRYSRRLSDLATLASVATLAGLLGTIFGLQQSFGSLAVAEAAQKATVLAAGISQAMNTTAFGLMVAMPCLVAHTRLGSLAARRTENCDAAVVKLLNYFDTRASRSAAAFRPRQAS